MLKTIAIGLIRENAAALRTVNRSGEKFLGIIESMREKGFFGAIVVRERTDEDTQQKYYELCDGLHRYTAAKECGIAEIGVDIKDFDDDQMLEAQIMGNFHKVETKPAEYAKGLKRILIRHPMMTESELAGKLGMSSQFIRARLSLNKITDKKILALIDDESIPLANAYVLAKLPEDEYENYLDGAITEKPDTFVPRVQERLKEIKEAARLGRLAEPPKFVPVAHMQKLAVIKTALDTGEMIATLIAGIDDPAAAAMRAIEWVLHLDPESVNAAQVKWDEKEATKAAKKAEAEKKKAEKKAAKEAKTADGAAGAAVEAGATAEANAGENAGNAEA